MSPNRHRQGSAAAGVVAATTGAGACLPQFGFPVTVEDQLRYRQTTPTLTQQLLFAHPPTPLLQRWQRPLSPDFC